MLFRLRGLPRGSLESDRALGGVQRMGSRQRKGSSSTRSNSSQFHSANGDAQEDVPSVIEEERGRGQSVIAAASGRQRLRSPFPLVPLTDFGSDAHASLDQMTQPAADGVPKTGPSSHVSSDGSSSVRRRRRKSEHEPSSNDSDACKPITPCTCGQSTPDSAGGQGIQQTAHASDPPGEGPATKPSTRVRRKRHEPSAGEKNLTPANSRKEAGTSVIGEIASNDRLPIHVFRNPKTGTLQSVATPSQFAPQEIPTAMLTSKQLLPRKELRQPGGAHSSSSESRSRSSRRNSQCSEDDISLNNARRLAAVSNERGEYVSSKAPSSLKPTIGNEYSPGPPKISNPQMARNSGSPSVVAKAEFGHLSPSLLNPQVLTSRQQQGQDAAKYVHSPPSQRRKDVNFELPPALGMVKEPPFNASGHEEESGKSDQDRSLSTTGSGSGHSSNATTETPRIRSSPGTSPGVLRGAIREQRPELVRNYNEKIFPTSRSDSEKNIHPSAVGDIGINGTPPRIPTTAAVASPYREDAVRQSRSPSPVSSLVRQGKAVNNPEHPNTKKLRIQGSDSTLAASGSSASRETGATSVEEEEESDRLTSQASQASAAIAAFGRRHGSRAQSKISSVQPTAPHIQTSPFENFSPAAEQRRLFQEPPEPPSSASSDAHVDAAVRGAAGRRVPLAVERPTSNDQVSANDIGRAASKSSPGRFLSGRTQVEEWAQGVAPCLLYARELTQANGTCRVGMEEGAVPTQPVKIISKEEQDFVYGDGAFQIHVVGLKVAQEPQGFSSGLAKLGLGACPPPAPKHRVLYSTRRTPTAGAQTLVPTIHYDSIRRESATQLQREYAHIPSGRGLVTCSRGSGSKEVVQLAMQFVLFQVQDDLQSKWCASTLDNVDALNSELQKLSSSQAPYFSMVEPFLKVSGALGDAALDQAGRSERLIDADFSFRLMSRDPALNLTRGGAVYLRYGYYFILSEPSTAKLHTCLDAGENVRLFTRREKDGQLQPAKNLSYIIIRVSEQSPSQEMFPSLQESIGDVELLRKLLTDAKDTRRSRTSARR